MKFFTFFSVKRRTKAFPFWKRKTVFFSCSLGKRTKRMRDRSGRSDLCKRSAFTRCSRHVFAQASLCKPRRQGKAESGFIPVCSFLCVFSLSQCNVSHCRANMQRGCCLRLIGFAPAGAGMLFISGCFRSNPKSLSAEEILSGAFCAVRTGWYSMCRLFPHRSTRQKQGRIFLPYIYCVFVRSRENSHRR